MVRTACTNIAASVAGQPIFASHVWTSQCLADYGGQGEVLGRLEKTNPAASSGDSGRWLQLVKIAYEKYFLDQVREGVAGLPYQPDLKENLKAGWRNGLERH
jgi:sulfide:quinone oxidoreductase